MITHFDPSTGHTQTDRDYPEILAQLRSIAERDKSEELAKLAEDISNAVARNEDERNKRQAQ